MLLIGSTTKMAHVEPYTYVHAERAGNTSREKENSVLTSFFFFVYWVTSLLVENIVFAFSLLM